MNQQYTSSQPPLQYERCDFEQCKVVDSSLLTIKTATGTASSNFQYQKLINFNETSSSSTTPSSAFVSALQSPYISPRLLVGDSLMDQSVTSSRNSNSNHQSKPATVSQTEDIPSSSYTPPTDIYEYSDDMVISVNDTRMRVYRDLKATLSFTFPSSRIIKGSVSNQIMHSNAKLRSCDVFIGFHGQNPNLPRFCKWLKSELEIQGISSFIADRSNYTDNQSHEIADRVICSVTHGIVVITQSSFMNHLSIDEIRFFAQKRNLIPVWFDTDIIQVIEMLKRRNSVDTECQEAIDELIKSNELKMEAKDGNWRSCVNKAAGVLKNRLGRKSAAIVQTGNKVFQELPFPRNKYFIGRETEITQIEAGFFGCSETCISLPMFNGEASGQSDGLADEETDTVAPRWPVNLVKKVNHKRSKCLGNKGFSFRQGTSSIMCINGVSGMGKSELALEFAYRYHQRYKTVFWIGGEVRYFRQNLLNLSQNLELDLCADLEDKGRTRSFEEQEMEVFKRVKRELFSDMPYLLIIDNLESENEWWEDKTLHDLIPRWTSTKQ